MFTVCRPAGLVLLSFSGLVLASGTLAAAAQGPAPAAASGAAHTPKKCTIHRAPAGEADIALDRGRFDEAVLLFRTQAASTPADPDRVHNGLIRALLGARKFSEAEADATAWYKAEPKNVWSQLAVGEVQWRKGRVAEGLTSLLAAAALDPCNAQARVDYARAEELSGMAGSAKRNLDFAHSLEPNDPVITSAWVNLQPRAVQLAELTTYMTTRQDFSDSERKSLERQKERLSQPTASRCQLEGSVKSTSLPYRGIQDGPRSPVYWGLDVAFNGKTRRLEIDTGAHGLLLSRSAAASLHLTPDERGKVGGMGEEGDVDSFVANVDTLKIGSLEFRHCDVRVLGKSVRTMEALDGLIGGDVFADFLLMFDFPGRILKLDPLPIRPDTPALASKPSLATGATIDDDAPRDRYIDDSMKSWTKVLRSGHDLILPVQLNEGPWRLFIVDTGSSLNLISNEAAREVAKVSNGADLQLYGLSGEVKKLYTTGALTLTFANMRQPAFGMTAMDTSRFGSAAGMEIAGFLGAPTLHQLTVQIDYRDELMNFSFDPKRIHHCMDNTSSMPQVDCY